jgi:uncharacterized protein (TIGR00369 family)
MDIQTHKRINRELCGKPVHLEEAFSRVTMNTTDKMRVDNSGLVHGGFVFGLADYAAMIAVNHPNVVLGSADAKFLKPIRVNELITAEAKVIKKPGRKRNVQVFAMKGNEKIFEGEFICFVLDKHVFN